MQNTIRGLTIAAIAVGVFIATVASPVGGVDRTDRNELSAAMPTAALEPRNATEHVVVVTIDGVRWQDVFNGVDGQLLQAEPPHRTQAAARWTGLSAKELLPRLYGLSQSSGAWVGAFEDTPMRASGPNFVSLPGYLEILTGTPHNTCRNNLCNLSGVRTLFDEWHETRANDRLALFASWQGLGRLVTPGKYLDGITGNGDSQGMTPSGLPTSLNPIFQKAKTIPSHPGHQGYLPDLVTRELAIQYLNEYRPNLLVVNLGNTDEFAHAGNYSGYLSALHEADAFVGQVSDALQVWQAQGAQVALIVTSDHGREQAFRGHGSFAPESARVWMLASGTQVRARGFVPGSRVTRLADIAPTLRKLAGLRAVETPNGGQVIAELF